MEEREREREREEKRREDNTLLHRDKDLSTCRLFCKSVPDDKHSNINTSNKNSIKYARENYKNILTNKGKRQNNDYLTIYV